MNTYIFRTTTKMKPYNSKKWWICSDYVSDKKVRAKSLKDALEEFSVIVKHDAGIEISKTALKEKKPMYIGSTTGREKQIGYVITGSCDFRDDEKYRWSKQYIDLWVKVSQEIDVFK